MSGISRDWNLSFGLEIWTSLLPIWVRCLISINVFGLFVYPPTLDLSNAKKNWNKSAGYTEDEVSAFKSILNPTSSTATSTSITNGTVAENVEDTDNSTTLVESTTTLSSEVIEIRPSSKLVDVWRHLHPTDRQYTYFNYRFNCREKGLGWRIDMCKPFSPSRLSFPHRVMTVWHFFQSLSAESSYLLLNFARYGGRYTEHRIMCQLSWKFCRSFLFTAESSRATLIYLGKKTCMFVLPILCEIWLYYHPE